MKNNFTCLFRNAITLSIFTVLISNTSFAQEELYFNKWEPSMEAGINFGPTFFLGDLGGNRGIGTKFIKDINPEVTKLAKGVYFNYYPNQMYGFRLTGQYTYVAGDDALISTNGRDELCRKERNLNFRSSIWEVNAAVEVYPTLFFFNNNYDRKEPRLKPYVFAGVGVFHFNPEGSLKQNGKETWYQLRDLNTEGQGMLEYPDRKPYALTQINIPMGFGVKIKISDKVNTSIECNYKQTFTDYMDDVSKDYIDPNLFDRYLSPEQANIARLINDKSIGILTPGPSRYQPGFQRGNPTNTDAYFSFLFKFGYNIGNGRHREYSEYKGNFWRRATRAIRCPHLY